MNRSILIVICDFLVSAMLSMMTGMVPAHSGGTGVGLDESTTRLLLIELENQNRELEALRVKLRSAVDRAEHAAELQRINAELAQNRMQQAALRDTLRRTAANTGEISPQELKHRLDDEKLQRIKLEYELRDRDEDLVANQAQLADLRSESADLRRSLQDTGSSLQQLSGSLLQAQRQLSAANERLAESSRLQAQAEARAAEAGEKLTASREELAETGAKLAARESDLAGVRQVLQEMTRRVNRAGDDNQKLRNSLAFYTGKLSTTERDLADSRGQVELLNQRLAQRELEYGDLQRRQTELEQTVRRTVQELTEAQSSLEQSRGDNTKLQTTAAAAQAELKSVQTQLEYVRKLLNNDVLAKYDDAVLELELKLVEERLWTDNVAGGVYYLPLITVKGKTYLPGYFATLTGYGEKPVSFNKIRELEYLISVPGKAEIPARRLVGPLHYLKEMPQIAALPVPSDANGRQPLEVITRSQLKQRGLQQLMLFKNSSFGRNCVNLGNRCSLDMASGDNWLFIRNASRGTGNELRAEPGDFVLSGDGKFVGIVIGETTDDFGRRHNAKVHLFPDDLDWEKEPQISLAKSGSSTYYNDFSRQVREVRDKLESQ